MKRNPEGNLHQKNGRCPTKKIVFVNYAKNPIINVVKEDLALIENIRLLL